MEAVKRATFAVYPVKPGESREDAWKQYKTPAVARSVGLERQASGSIAKMIVPMKIFIFIRIVLLLVLSLMAINHASFVVFLCVCM